jgi:hypothetical protein
MFQNTLVYANGHINLHSHFTFCSKMLPLYPSPLVCGDVNVVFLIIFPPCSFMVKRYNNAKNWFMTNATSPGNTFNESQFSQFMGRLTDFNEHESLDIFDLFGTSIFGFTASPAL